MCPADRSGDFAGQLGGGGFAVGGFLEEEDGGQGLAGDVVSAEDGHHLVRQDADLGGVTLLQVGNHQVQGGEGGFKGIPVIEEGLADAAEELAGSLVLAQAGGHAALHPAQAEMIHRAPVRCSQVPELREEVGRFLVAAHLGEVVDKVVVDAEDEARIALGIDQAGCLLKRADGGLGIALLNVCASLQDEALAGEVWIPMLAVEKELHGVGEQLERLWETPLCQAQRGLQVQKDGLVAQGILGAPGSRLPPGVRHVEAPLGSCVVSVHPAGVPQRGPGEAPELVDPALLEEAAVRDSVRHVDRQVGEVDGLSRLLRCGLAAPADQQLAEAPAHETRIIVQPGEAFLPIRREALQALAEERERRHKAELAALEAQMQARLEALTRANEALTRDLERARRESLVPLATFEDMQQDENT
jgi:hypothetical protein